VTSTDSQVRRLREEMTKHGNVSRAALRAGMDRKTARGYIERGRLPSETKPTRTWRTREDPFESDWPEIAELIRGAPDLNATVILEHLCDRHPDRYEPGQVRTLQRRLKVWRAQEGPEKEVFFPQQHHPGEALQGDFTWCSDLEITIAGEPFPHGLWHEVLPYSNWEWATIGLSESLETLRRGVQATVFRLGRVPRFHQTDQSSAATHELGTGKRGFNVAYQELMDHLGMAPRTIAVGACEQNGDIEAANGAFKRRLNQELLLRGSRDFECVEDHERLLTDLLERCNRRRQKKLDEELQVMSRLSARRLPEFTEIEARVTSHGTLRAKNNGYSVPSQLIGEKVRVRIFARTIEVHHGQKKILEAPRLVGEGKHRIEYRHVIHSLVRKPGAFERYRYRDDLFPSSVFRQAYERLHQRMENRKADLHYLRILKLAADTQESEVQAAIEELMLAHELPTVDAVRQRVAPIETEVPDIDVGAVNLVAYDTLLSSELEVAS